MTLYCPNPNWPESRVPKSTSYQRVIWHIFNDLSQSGRHSSKCLVPLPVYLEENYQQWRRSVSLSPWGLLVHSIDGVLAPRLPLVFCVGKAAVAVVCLCHEWGLVVKRRYDGDTDYGEKFVTVYFRSRMRWTFSRNVHRVTSEWIYRVHFVWYIQ